MKKRKFGTVLLMIFMMVMTGLLACGMALAASGNVIEDTDDTIKRVSGPEINDAEASVNNVPVGTVKISADIKAGSYTDESGLINNVQKTTVSLMRNGKKVKQDVVENGQVVFKTAVSYDKKDKFVLKTSMNVNGRTYQGEKASFKIRSAQMEKNNVAVTKLSNKSAMVRWGGVDEATSYRVYMGKKKVKELGSGARKYLVKKKKAGRLAYRVLPVIKIEGKKYEGKSNKAAPKANVLVTSNTGTPSTYSTSAKFVLKKITLKGKSYKIKGWGVNYSGSTKLKEFSSIKVSIICDGKIVVNKTIKNVKCALGPKQKKAMTLTVKGKKNVDIRNGWVDYSFMCVCDPAELTP